MSARNFKIKDGQVTLSVGNAKLDKSIAIFNLPAGSAYTCNCDCKGCYAKKAQYLYKQVLPCRVRNWEASKSENFVNSFQEALNKAKKFGCSVVRLHESGDIYSKEYAEKLEKIASNNPDMKFYYYTKTDYQVKGCNVNQVNSLLPNGNINYGKLDYVKEQSKANSVKVCPVTLGVKTAICGKTCKLCQHESYMLFVIH